MSDQLFLPTRRRRHRALTGATIIPIAALIATSLALPAQAANPAPTASAAFSGGTGTVSAGGTLYAKQGATVTLTVTTTETMCVDISGAFAAHQQSASPKATWTFTTTAGAGDGAQAVTVVASEKFNSNGVCNGQSTSTQASYVLDNTGPVVIGALTPAPNAAGWNKNNVTVAWSATDSGSGVGSGPTPSGDTVNSETGGVTKSATAADRLGNTNGGSVLVKLDKTNPTISGSWAPAPNAAGWNNTNVTVTLVCSDALSLIKTCTGGGSVPVTTEGANQSVNGTAVDNADNSATGSVTGINIDKTAPSLTGAPTTVANGFGWYKDNVTIGWNANDALSGVTSTPANSTVTGEGTGLKATATVSDKAGNTTTANSAAVNIDRTAPTTGISGTSNNWTNGNVTVSLSPSDNLSGVGSTSYSVDGGATQTGTSFTLSSEGDHTVTFFSTDKAGNAEKPQTAHVKIDKTAPTIGHSFTPLTYVDGAWTNQDVTVTFNCADTGSGVASCSAPVTKSAEGAAQQVTGSATDNAGNSASNTALVSIDKTKPVVTAAPDRPANGAGWYNHDVTVRFSGTDALSGIANVSADKVLGEGTDQSASGSATDAAGNVATAQVTGINVDKTAPVLNATFSSGWHTDDVLVTWSCTDARSGVATGPANDTVKGEGDDLSSTATCTDMAGNTATKTVSGIKIDRTAPTTTVDVPNPLASGWYADAVKVKLTGHDTLSGIGATYYRVDNGAVQLYNGEFNFATKGEHTIGYWSKDAAGNTEATDVNSITLKIDGNPPTTTVINPISPASGWFVTSGIPVAFDAKDVESGIAATYYQVDGGEPQTYGEPFTQDLSTGTHTITYWSVDLAGNAEAKKATQVKVDTVPPVVTGSRTPAANTYGWNNTDVNVSFDCTDAASGVDTVVACGPNATVDKEGEAQKVVGTTRDVAGNTNSATVDHINIDKTAPGLTGAATTNPNAAGWYKDDVKIAWTGTDSLSGIDPLTQPDESTIVGEGNNLGASASISDKAGNEGTGSVSGVKIDRTAPVVTGAPTTKPNEFGWYRGSVVVDFKCSDNLSGVAACPTSRSIGTDGADQSVTSDPATDVAGNDSAGKTVGGINIDSKAPSTTANNQCTAVNDWCKGATADVVLAATDQAGLSGVKEVHYKVDGGTEQVAAGATKTVTVPLDGSGRATVTFWSVDKAGNVEGENSVALKWDNIAPTVTHTVDPTPNAAGWNNSDTTVTFDAKDDDAGSGVDTVAKPVTVSTETAGQVVEGSATDTAGNVGKDSVEVKLDKTAPTISGAIVSGQKGNNGWYVGPVKVHFTCDDNLSGVVTCPDDVTLTDNGTNSATGMTTDKAGNTATTTVGGIKIDQTKPTTTAAVPPVPASGWYAEAVKVTLTGHDDVSDVDATYYKVDDDEAQLYKGAFDFGTVGTHTISYWSVDAAGNVEDAAGNSITLKVDTVAPGIEGARTPKANAHGWNNTDVDVTFTCSDAESGLASCSPKTTVSSEGAGQKVVGNAADNAGNTNSATVDNINIDKTAPGLTGEPTTPGNAAGWYKGDVKIHWTGTDTLSGIDSDTQPVDSTISGQGDNLGATASISDKAGNEGTGSVSGVKIDRTAPVVTGAPTTKPNEFGWYRGSVVVDFGCSDNLSGVAFCPTSKSIGTDGADQSVTSDPATDVAGNDSIGKTVGGINIDSKAPSTTANNQCTAVNDWCKGTTADVVLTATDQTGLSGVKEVHYKVDNGDEQVAEGATKTVTVPLDGSGKATVTYWSVDKAGNVEGANFVALKWDNISPTVTHKVDPTPNAAGWNKSDTTVTFSAKDDDQGSGVAKVSEPVTVSTETAGQVVEGSATDTAGNVGTGKVTVKLDKTAPTISGAIVEGTKGNNGWYVGPVKVHFTCDDNLSGFVTCPDDVTLVDNGTNSATGTTTDAAGNAATTTVGGIKIDQTKPTTTAVVPTVPASGWYAEAVPVKLTGDDKVSGVAATYYKVDKEDAQLYEGAFNFGTVGKHTIKYWSVDVAGNVEDATGNSLTLWVDPVPPGIKGARTPDANKYGWNNTDVDVTFTCSDGDSGMNGCGPDDTVSNEGAGQKVVGNAQDKAGNTSSATVDNINIDKTAPELTGTATTKPNAAGWYKGDVQIAWTGTDGLSHIDPLTQPANSTITGEGDNLGSTASISDKAGNKTTASVNGVKIDRTAPVVTGAPTTSPNEFGWYRNQVEVDFDCTDNLSGVAACPTSKVVSGDGANQSVTSDSATDNAGNDSAGKTVGGIDIDGTAPSTAANNKCTVVNGWCTGDTADVVLTATDQAGLSGVKEIHYKVDGGAEQAAAGTTKTVTVPLNGSGEGTVTYWSVDKAGNVETASAVALKWDNIAPTVTHSRNPSANANGWNNSDTTVTFSAKDDDRGSGVATVTEPGTVSTETAGQVVNGSAKDTAGNVGTDTVTVKLDKTAPSITGAIVSGTKGNNGWYTGPVKVHFTCSDALSGIATCPDDVTLNDNGTNAATGTATDKAGNTASATVSGIKIDRELPTITNVNVASGFYTLGAVPAATCTASDSFSGVAGSCTVKVTGGTPNGVGTFTYTATAVDNAGNTNTATGTYQVVYRYDGFLQPINDTAHQVGTTTSVFKAGSTVPVKLQLKKSNGTVVQTNAAPVWLAPVKGSSMNAPVDESVYTASADSGSTYRYDSSAQQYIYNWKTPNTGGNYYRIGVTLDDGQSYFVNIGLK